jgi:ABC-type nitrate/sulfonate/bicarbonate transport system ATPase subunit
MRLTIGEKRHQDQTILRNIQLEIPQGQRLVLMGPSGCGKTSLLNIVAGLDRRFVGSCDLPARTRLGYLFQEPRLLPWRTVRQNLVLAGGKPTLIDELLQQTGLEMHKHKYPGQLSLGMARRAALARCLAIDPTLMLLDEPLVSLDHAAAEELRQLINKLLTGREDITLICVTHDAREAISLGQRVVILGGSPTVVEEDLMLDAESSAELLQGRVGSALKSSS